MSSVQLTKDADKLVCALYKKYLEKRKQNISKELAKNTGSSEDIFNSNILSMSFEDIDETCRELDRANLLDCSYASDVVYDSFLTDEAIIYMENRFKNGLSDLLDYAQKFKFW